MHVGIAYPRWRGKRSRHSRCMRTRNFTYLARGPWRNPYTYPRDSLYLSTGPRMQHTDPSNIMTNCTSQVLNTGKQNTPGCSAFEVHKINNKLIFCMELGNTVGNHLPKVPKNPQTCMVDAPKWSRCLLFAVKSCEVYPGYQMKYKYVGKWFDIVE